MYTVGVINAWSNRSLSACLTVHVLSLYLNWVLLIRYVPGKSNVYFNISFSRFVVIVC